MSRWTVKPAIGSVLVKPMPESEMTEGGLYLVSAVEKETNICEVVDVCEPYETDARTSGYARVGPIHSIGDLVVVGKYNGRDLILDRQRFIIIRESDVLGKLIERPAE